MCQNIQDVPFSKLHIKFIFRFWNWYENGPRFRILFFRCLKKVIEDSLIFNIMFWWYVNAEWQTCFCLSTARRNNWDPKFLPMEGGSRHFEIFYMTCNQDLSTLNFKFLYIVEEPQYVVTRWNLRSYVCIHCE